MHVRRLVTGVTAGALYCGTIVIAACGGDGETVTNNVEVCPTSMTECGETCVDTTISPAHCGACDNACDTGEYCGAGTCTAGGGCSSPLTDCSGTCVNTDNDPENCGSCDDSCGTDEYCVSGSCTSGGCPLPFIDCSGTCTDINTDSEHCGGCTTACDPGEKCNGAGICDLTCQDGLIDCGGTCIDPNTNDTYCGATGDCLTTNAGTTCANDETCNGSGVCALDCQTGFIDCNGTCIDPATNETYCGATGDCLNTNAGITCGGGEICSGSACITSCGAGLTVCGTSCVDPNYDPAYCGVDTQCANGDVCTSSEYCANGICAPTASAGPFCATTTATTTMPAQDTTYSSGARGYYFTALSDFIITGVNITTLTGNQSIQILKLHDALPLSGSTNHTTLAYIKSSTSTSWINVCVPVFTGDVIGVLGERSDVTSYVTGPATVTIDGNSTTITRFYYQSHLSAGPAGAVYTGTSQIGRIDLQTAPM